MRCRLLPSIRYALASVITVRRPIINPMKIALATLIMILLLGQLLGAEEGLASWYGGKFQGRQTANGERFDTNKLTAAHKSLPFDTIVRVISVESGKSVEVRINDRGPFVEGRIIDLSRAAAEAIGMTGKGIAKVKLELVRFPAKPGRDTTYAIQVGAYRQAENALALKKRMADAGLQASLRKSESGITRVLIEDISGDRLEQTKATLAGAGISQILVRKTRTAPTRQATPNTSE